jgi:ATP-binding cassette subfamily C protein LapB
MSARQEPFLNDEAALAAAGEGAGTDDALLQSLVWLTRHHGRERSAASLLSGLPMSGALGPDQAIRVMREAGFTAGMIQRKLPDIHALLMPAVLLLKNGDACIVVRRLPPGEGGARYDVVMPGSEFHACEAAESELQNEYTGVAFVVSPQPVARAQREDILRDPGAHWLWGTMRRFLPYYRSALLAALLSNLLMMVTGLVTSVVFDKVIPHQAFVTLWALATAATLAMVFDMLSRQLRSHLIDTAGKKSDNIIGSLLFRQSLDVRWRLRAPARADRGGARVLRRRHAVGAERPAIHRAVRRHGLRDRRPARLGAGDGHPADPRPGRGDPVIAAPVDA